MVISRLLCFVAALLVSFPFSFSNACDEKVTIDSVEYSVGQIWCGKMLDSTNVANMNHIARVPDEYCFDGYRIYVEINTRDAFVEMAQTAKVDSIDLIIKSGYRSRRYQSEIIARRLAEGYSFQEIIKYVAPPGYSEHETGQAIDLNASDTVFGNSQIYNWLKKNAHKFGFVESLPKDSTSLMPWEPWHWRYQSSP